MNNNFAHPYLTCVGVPHLANGCLETSMELGIVCDTARARIERSENRDAPRARLK